MEDFLRFDFKQVKMASIRPRPNIMDPEYPKDPLDSPKPCMCECVMKDGTMCGMTFGSLKAMRLHQRRTKNPLHPTSLDLAIANIVHSNMCPFCETVHKSKQVAINHAWNALSCGKCAPDRSFHKSRFIPCATYSCVFCLNTFQSAESYNAHLSQHIKPPSIDREKRGKVTLHPSRLVVYRLPPASMPSSRARIVGNHGSTERGRYRSRVRLRFRRASRGSS